MPFVLDASIAASWIFTDEASSDADAALERMRTDTAFVPSIWWFEIRNTLVMNERRGRVTEPDSEAFLHVLSLMPVVVDTAPNEKAVLALARRHRLTVYDAAYLELAQREGVPLATLDQMLKKAAQAEGLSLAGESS